MPTPSEPIAAAPVAPAAPAKRESAVDAMNRRFAEAQATPTPPAAPAAPAVVPPAEPVKTVEAVKTPADKKPDHLVKPKAGAKKAEAAPMIRLSCSPEVRHIVKGIRNPHKMLNTLETSLDTGGSYIGRWDILRRFRACQPKDDEPLNTYFTKLSNYHIQLDHTHDTATDRDFRTQIFTSLPSPYGMRLIVLKHHRPIPTPEQAIHDRLEEATPASIAE